MKHTKREIERATKKVEIAIDKMVDLKDLGFGYYYDVEAILQHLRHIESSLYLNDSNEF